ncbi:hypothetical protein DH2020_034193 [Rehmannia glutinosa]|uniref:Retrovirus-related Pol polyprotein from transposon TNT 1-94 n=1 Tax=Rehmannia glutinosa TaxID=99300 RepID=A0ABR0VDE6_REHGL
MAAIDYPNLSGSTSADMADSNTSFPPSLRLLLQNMNSFLHLKLDNGNYNLWRAQIHSVLDAHGLLHHILDPSSRPTMLLQDPQGVSIPNPQFLNWQLVDKHLRSCLFASISPSVLPHVISLSTASEIWIALEQRYQSFSRTHIYQLKMQLLNLSKGSKSMQAYLDDVKVLNDNLAAVNESVKDEDLMLYILRGLPQEYESFKASFRLNLQPSFTLHDFAGLLIAEELNLQLTKTSFFSESTPSPEPHTLLFTNHRGRGSHRGRGYGRNNNFRGNPGRGHFSGRGSSSIPGNPSQTTFDASSLDSRNDPKTWCQICGKPYHKAIDCWAIKNEMLKKDGKNELAIEASKKVKKRKV